MTESTSFSLTDALASVTPVVAVVEQDPVWRHEAVERALQEAEIGTEQRPLVRWSLTRQFEPRGVDGGGLAGREEGAAHRAHPGGALATLLEWLAARTTDGPTSGGEHARFGHESFQFGVVLLEDLGIFLSDPLVQRQVFDLYRILSTAPATAIIALSQPLEPRHPLHPIAVQVQLAADPAARYGGLARELVETLHEAGGLDGDSGADGGGRVELIKEVVAALDGLPIAHADAVTKVLVYRVGRSGLQQPLAAAVRALNATLGIRSQPAGG